MIVVTATALEYRAARAALEGRAQVVQAGIGLTHLNGPLADTAISCGVAGGVRRDLPTGTVLVPRSISAPDGSPIACDGATVRALVEAARRLGYEPVTDSIATRTSLVHGNERIELAARGYAGVDMESGLIKADRLACVRVILDTPQREISPVWIRPASAIVHPQAWRDLPFLLAEGPRCAARAASIVAALFVG